VKPIKWICPYCYSAHTDSFIRCVGCGTKRSQRFEVDAALLWISPDVTGPMDTRGCWISKRSTKGEEK
jgi:hypothetical protein